MLQTQLEEKLAESTSNLYNSKARSNRKKEGAKVSSLVNLLLTISMWCTKEKQHPQCEWALKLMI